MTNEKLEMTNEEGGANEKLEMGARGGWGRGEIKENAQDFSRTLAHF